MSAGTVMSPKKAVEILSEQFAAAPREVEKRILMETAKNRWFWQAEYDGAVALMQRTLFGKVVPVVVMYANGDWEDYALEDALAGRVEPNDHPKFGEYAQALSGAVTLLQKSGDLAEEIGLPPEIASTVWDLAQEIADVEEMA